MTCVSVNIRDVSASKTSEWDINVVKMTQETTNSAGKVVGMLTYGKVGCTWRWRNGHEMALGGRSKFLMSGRFQLVMESGGTRPAAALTDLTCPLDTDS